MIIQGLGGAGAPNCGFFGVPVSKTGSVSNVGNDFLTVGGFKIYMNNCTKTQFRPGRRNFAPSDNVSYEAYRGNNGRYVARKIVCN